MTTKDPARTCYVCDGAPHADTSATGGHKFWSIADAYAHFRAEDRGRSVRYPGGESSPEAAYINEYRPY